MRGRFVAMQTRLTLLIVCFLSTLQPCNSLANEHAKRIDVGVFWSNRPTEVLMTVKRGAYEVWSNDHKVMDFTIKDVLVVSMQGHRLFLKTFTSSIGTYDDIELRGINDACAINVKPTKPSQTGRFYEDDFLFSVWQNRLKIINRVDMDDYLAGVVQSEVGNKRPIEFYKTQAIICRTYALKHWYKYEDLGFNLCDRVSSQVYKTGCWNDTILEAVKATRDLVLVDDDVNLIAAVFHSNSGGQTTNSEDVWTQAESYLRSVPDTFSLKMPHQAWETTISKPEWLGYFHNYAGIDITDTATRDTLLGFCPTERPVFMFASDSLVPVKTIRRDFKLKSTWFCVTAQSDSVHLAGRGFGHGVGLPQEGAAYMAQTGYNYQDILHYYYQNIHIIKLSLIDYLRDEYE